MSKRRPRTTREVLAHNLTALQLQSNELQTQRQLAARSGVGGNTIGRAQRGDGNVTVDNLDRIAHALHVPVWQLLRNGTVHEPDGLGPIETIAIEPTKRVNGVELPQSAVDVALAWMALPERERNEFKRMIMEAAAPYRDPASIGDGQSKSAARKGTKPKR
jgi:transcriptional regulator with XRE-family HTH domain